MFPFSASGSVIYLDVQAENLRIFLLSHIKSINRHCPFDLLLNLSSDLFSSSPPPPSWSSHCYLSFGLLSWPLNWFTLHFATAPHLSQPSCTLVTCFKPSIAFRIETVILNMAIGLCRVWLCTISFHTIPRLVLYTLAILASPSHKHTLFPPARGLLHVLFDLYKTHTLPTPSTQITHDPPMLPDFPVISPLLCHPSVVTI